MKKRFNILFIICALICSIPVLGNTDNPYIRGMKIEKQGDKVILNLEFDFTDLQLKKNKQFIFTPVLVNGSETYTFTPVEVLGRKANLYQQRNKPYEVPTQLITKRTPGYPLVSYTESVPYEKWMNHAQLMISEDLCGCNKAPLNSENTLITDVDIVPPPFIPVLSYVEPEFEAIKSRSAKGTAFLDFKIGRTEILPDFRNNKAELNKIRDTLNIVQNEEANTLVGMTIHGYASPDGSFANNERLAKNRATSLKNYIQSAYGIADSYMQIAYTAEDWKGFRDAIIKSSLSDKTEILEVIDGNLSPDAKESRIRVKHAQSYKHIKENIYPSLRRSEYTIAYEVRPFTVEETRQMLMKNPKLVSSAELYRLALSYQPGSEEYNETFRAAAVLFPNDEVAHLNAANSCLGTGCYKDASEHLSKVSDSPEKTHAIGLLYFLQGEKEQGIKLIKKAAAEGVKEAQENIERLRKSWEIVD